MSAYLCDSRHLSALVNGCPKRGGWCIDRSQLFQGMTPADLFAMLLAENVKSLDARYPDGGMSHVPASYRYDPNVRYESAVEYLVGARCYQYQSCEDDGWDTSAAKAWLDGRLREAERQFPGYEDANWGAPYTAAERLAKRNQRLANQAVYANID